jgi:tetratricopeptide (TPR) repeat protein
MERAVSYFEKSLMSEDMKIKGFACYNLCLIYYELDAMEKAKEYNEKFLELEPENICGNYQQGLILTGLKDLEGAIKHFDLALSGKTEDEEFHSSNAPFEQFIKSIFKVPAREEILYQAAIACLNKGKKSKASRYFNEYISIAPSGPEAEEVRKYIKKLGIHHKIL